MWILIVILWAELPTEIGKTGIGAYGFATPEACESAKDLANDFFSDLYFEGPISTLCLHVDARVSTELTPEETK